METDNCLETYHGTVKRIIYRNQSNGYTVALISCDSGREITAVGTMPDAESGDELELEGLYTTHKNYGEQFKVNNYKKTLPVGSAAILRYLSAGAVSGVGPATAKRIVAKFGDKSLEIMENDPQSLSLIKGISFEKAERIASEIGEIKSFREANIELCSLGFSQNESLRIIGKLGTGLSDKLRRNPYILCEKDMGIGFERVDEIALNMEVPSDFPQRLGCGTAHILKHNLINGHTCLPREKLLPLAAKMLDTDTAHISDACDEFVFNGTLCETQVDGTSFISLKKYCTAERRIAGRLLLIDRAATPVKPVTSAEITATERKVGVQLDELQREAVVKSTKHGMLVLTGGPGTGKTTTLKAIIELMKSRNLKISLAAPTGRAAKRMTELTGLESKTIHRLLEVEWSEDEDEHIFSKNDRSPLDCDLLIIDEFSMVDTLLFQAVLDAVPLGCRLILVGDPDQLPSVGAGDLLADIISAKTFRCVRLDKVFRQGTQSLIVTNAHRIVKGEEPELDKKDADFFMLDGTSPDGALRLVRSLYSERLPAAYGFEPTTDIQVICPSKIMQLGTVSVNNMLQESVNPRRQGRAEISMRGFCLRVGDKVMQTKNNYDILWTDSNGKEGIGVYNGDIGELIDIDFQKSCLTVKFDDHTAIYGTEEAEQLELAYAVTVHKSQGSEFECVILPLLDVPQKLLYRNLLYTAVTRAKKLIIIIGARRLVTTMVKNDRKTQRYTLLDHFLTEAK